MDRPLKIGVLTCSDRCTRGEAEDVSGPLIGEMCSERGWEVVGRDCCRDEVEPIASIIRRFAEVDGADVVLTTGGTGLGPRDVTPEATMSVCEREVPGIAEAIRCKSLEITGRAMLSRAVAAQHGHTLVINLPGSAKAVREALGFVIDQLEHAVDMMSGGGH